MSRIKSPSGKTAQRMTRKEKAMIKKIAAGAVFFILFLIAYSYITNYVSPEQKDARVLVEKAEKDLSSVQPSENIEENTQLTARLEKLKKKLERVSPKFEQEHERAKELIAGIGAKLEEIRSKSDDIHKQTAALTRFKDIEEQIANNTVSFQQAVSSLENIRASYPDTEAAEKAAQKLRDINRLKQEEEKNIIAEAKSDIRTLTASGRYREALQVMEDLFEIEFMKVTPEEVEAVAGMKNRIIRKAVEHFEQFVDNTVQQARKGDCEYLKETLRKEHERIGLTELEGDFQKAIDTIDMIKAERITRARAKLHKELGHINRLSSKRMYREVAQQYERLLPKITEPELKKEIEGKKRSNNLYLTAKNCIITLVNEKKGIKVLNLGSIKNLSHKTVTLEIDNQAMDIGWDKIRDSEFLILLQKAVKQYDKAELYTAYALLLIEKEKQEDADTYFQKALSLSNEIKEAYPVLFAAYHARVTKMQEQAEKTAQAKKEIKKIKDDADQLISVSSRRIPRNILVTGNYSTKNYSGQFNAHIVDNGKVEVITEPEPVRAGKYAGKFILDPDSQRCELVPRGARAPALSERWYGFSIFIPKEWKANSQDEVVAQWHGAPDKGEPWRSPPLALRTKSTTWKVTTRWDSKEISHARKQEGKLTLLTLPIKKDEWTDWVFHVKWSWKKDGLVEIWRNGKLVKTHKGPNCFNDKKGPYFKWGMYHTKENRILYNDEFRMGSDKATYQDVAPPGRRIKPKYQRYR